MEGLTNAMLNLTTNEERMLPNGLSVKCMSHPTRQGYTQMTVAGGFEMAGISIVSDIEETPIDMPLTILSAYLAAPEEPGMYRAHVFGPQDAYAIGTLDKDTVPQVLIISVRNAEKDMWVQLFERA